MTNDAGTSEGSETVENSEVAASVTGTPVSVTGSVALKKSKKENAIRTVFLGSRNEHPIFNTVSVFSKSSMVFWLLFFVILFLTYLYKAKSLSVQIGVIMLFLLLMFKPRFIHFLNVQLFGSIGRESGLGTAIKVLLVVAFILIPNIYVQSLFIAVFVVIELLLPMSYKLFLKIEERRIASGRRGSGIIRMFLISILLDALDMAVFFYLPGMQYAVGIDIVSLLVGFFLWGPLGVLVIIDMIASFFGFGQFLPILLIIGIIAYSTGTATRNLSADERRSVSNFTTGPFKIVIFLLVALLLISAPFAYFSGGNLENLPGVLMYQATKSKQYAEIGQVGAASFFAKAAQKVNEWWEKQLKIATGDYYAGQVDKYAKEKLGVFIKKAEPYEEDFFLDDATEKDAVIGIQLAGNALELEDCNNYVKKKKQLDGSSGSKNDLISKFLNEIDVSDKDRDNARSALSTFIYGTPLQLKFDLTDKDVDAADTSSSLLSSQGLYASYEDCRADQLITLACKVGNTNIPCLIKPETYGLYDLVGGGEGFEAFVPKDKLDKDKNAEAVDISVKFPFTTKAYLKTYFMDDNKKRDLKRSGEDILKFYGIADKEPKPVYTSGPIMVGIETPQSLPLAVKPSGEQVSTRLGITIENSWDGTLKKINLLLIIVPKGISLECTPKLSDKTIDIDDAKVYSFDESVLKTEFNIKDLKTFYCRMMPDESVLDLSPITTKYIKVLIQYDYEVSEQVFLTYRRGDKVPGDELKDCSTSCADWDGCFCPMACKLSKADYNQNCNGDYVSEGEEAGLTEQGQEVSSEEGSDFFNNPKPEGSPDFYVRTTVYYTPYEGDFSNWYDFYEDVKMQGSGVGQNNCLYRYHSIQPTKEESPYECNGLRGITVTGTNPTVRRTIAVNDKTGTQCYIPYNSKAYVDLGDGNLWTGWYAAEDTGSAFHGECKIDIYAGVGKAAMREAQSEADRKDVPVYVR